MKNPKKKFYNFRTHFRVISAPTQISGKGGVTPSRADQRFFSIYQFEILTYFSLSKNLLKKKRKKKLKIKSGVRAFAAE